MDSSSGGLGGRRLLGSNGSESYEKFVVDCTSILQEGSNDTLDAFDAVHV